MAGGASAIVDLAQRCSSGADERAWTDLVRILQPLFARAAYRVALEWGRESSPEIDDIVQEVFFKLSARGAEALRRVPGGNEQAATAYLKVLAANTARDYLKARYAQKRGRGCTVNLDERISEIVSGVETRPVDRDILIRQIDESLDATEQERSIFWLYYRQGLTAREIAALPGCALGPKGVESLLWRMTNHIRRSMGQPHPPATNQFPEGETA
jgi:RNA polymerase sigma-70 factor, ECF subfamily